MSRVLSLLHDTVVEVQPRELAVDESLGAVLLGRSGMRNRRRGRREGHRVRGRGAGQHLGGGWLVHAGSLPDGAAGPREADPRRPYDISLAMSAAICFGAASASGEMKRPSGPMT